MNRVDRCHENARGLLHDAKLETDLGAESVCRIAAIAERARQALEQGVDIVDGRAVFRGFGPEHIAVSVEAAAFLWANGGLHGVEGLALVAGQMGLSVYRQCQGPDNPECSRWVVQCDECRSFHCVSCGHGRYRRLDEVARSNGCLGKGGGGCAEPFPPELKDALVRSGQAHVYDYRSAYPASLIRWVGWTRGDLLQALREASDKQMVLAARVTLAIENKVCKKDRRDAVEALKAHVAWTAGLRDRARECGVA
jgi:hypothetical protein